MKVFLFTILCGLMFLMLSCDNNIAHGKPPGFLAKYKETTLPITMKGCFGNSHYLPLILPDSLIAQDSTGMVPYCTFKTNGDYYAVIKLGLADCALPVLATYDKRGKQIDEKCICIGYCGDGPGFTCEEFAIIRTDFSIYTADTMSTMEIDSLGNEVEGTLQRSVLYKKGRLLSTGRIELTDTIGEIIK